jgi:hypothetical protein
MGVMILLVIIPGIFINRWLTAKEKLKDRQGFEVKLTTDSDVVMKEKRSEQESD